METGDSIKVWLPGETPWAVVEIVHGPDLIEAKIDNFLFHQWSREDQQKLWPGGDLPKLHDYKQDDIVLFRLIEGQWMAQQKVTSLS